MFPINQSLLTRLACGGVVAMALAALASARAEMPGDAHFVTPGAIPAAMPTAAPAAMPAVIAAPQQPDQSKPAAPAPAAAPTPVTPVACLAPAEFTRLDRPLPRTARRLAGGEPLTVVAIGSSSTAGAGASSPAASYPSRLAVELKARFPEHAITVLNRGINGEETPDMMARFDSGVIAEHPQLVLWQIGTNSVLRDHPLEPHAAQLHEGIAELKATDADVVLIDPQFAPKVLAKSEAPGMVDQIALAAKDENVDLFHRFAVMRNWYEVQHIAFDAFLSPDQLHMNDWSYACVAKLLARAITEAATRPIASAAARPSR